MIDHSNRAVTTKCDDVVIHRNEKKGTIGLLSNTVALSTRSDSEPFLPSVQSLRSQPIPIIDTEQDPRNKPQTPRFPNTSKSQAQTKTPLVVPQLYPLLPSVATASPVPAAAGSIGSTPLYPLLPSVSTVPATFLAELKDLTAPLYPLRPSRGTGWTALYPLRPSVSMGTLL